MNKTNKTVFTLAWQNAKTAARIHGGKPSEYFAESLKLAHRGITVTARAPHQSASFSQVGYALMLAVIGLLFFFATLAADHPAAWISIGLWAIGCGAISLFLLWDYWTDRRDDKKRFKHFNQFNLLVRA